MTASIISLYVLTVCDHNSGFYGTSKKLIVDRLEKSKEAHDLLAACGTQLPVTQQVISDLELFVIRYVYGDTKNKTIGDARSATWRAQKIKSTIQLVPDLYSLHPYLERANYLAYLRKHTSSKVTHHRLAMNGILQMTYVCLSIQLSRHSLMSQTCSEEDVLLFARSTRDTRLYYPLQIFYCVFVCQHKGYQAIFLR